MNRTRLLLLAVLAAFFVSEQAFAQDGAAPREKIAEALGWFKQPPRDTIRFDYAMTARVRLLVFWAGKDDVGEGYIRRGLSKDDPRQERIEVLFGSDPAKAPRAINRWGGGTEILWHKGTPDTKEAFDEIAQSAFFGFMKSSQGKSAGEMQAELNKEKNAGEHRFTGILSRVSPGHAVSLTEPLVSHADFNLHQYAEAEPLILEKLSSPTRPIRELNDTQGCQRAGAFLQSIAELIEAALQAKKTPVAVCYIYDAQVHTLTLQRTAPLQKLAVHVRTAKGEPIINKTYEDLLEAEFTSETRKTGKRSEFTIAIGKNGELHGVPVQIRYQPNWWLQVVLNLRQLSGGGT